MICFPRGPKSARHKRRPNFTFKKRARTMRLNRIESYGRQEVEEVLHATDRKLGMLLRLFGEQGQASRLAQPATTPPTLTPRLALGINEAARAVGVSPWTMRGYIKVGKLKAVHFGRRVLLQPEELNRFLSGRQRTRQQRRTPQSSFTGN